MFKHYTYALLGLVLMPFLAISQEREEEHDGPAKRAAWERRITQDPKTGSIPRQELENSRNRMNTWFQAVKQSRLEVAIPNIKWTERGPNNVGGMTRALLWDPNNGTTKKKVWAGGSGGGLWYNNDITNANSSWNKVDDLWDNIGISWIAVHPKNPQIMYVSTGVREQTEAHNGLASAGGGIWKSTNGGGSWSRLASTIPDYVKNDTITAKWRNIYKVIVTDHGNVLALTRGGIFRSKNGGSTWNLLNGTNAPTTTDESVSDMEMGKDGILYVAEGTSIASPRILKSTDSTITNFINCTLPKNNYETGRVEMALVRNTEGNQQVIYAVSAAESKPIYRFFLKSTNGGASWSEMTPATHKDDGKDVPFFDGQGFMTLY